MTELNNAPENAENQSQDIDWSSFDVNSIPKEVLEKHAYVNALHKRIADRTNDLKAAKQQPRQQQRQQVSEPPVNEGEAEPEQAAPSLDNPPQWLGELVERVQNVTNAERESLLDNARDMAIERFKLSPDAKSFLTGKSVADINTAAAKLAALQPSKTSPGNGGTSEPSGKTQMLINRLNDGSGDPMENLSPFDPRHRFNK